MHYLKSKVRSTSVWVALSLFTVMFAHVVRANGVAFQTGDVVAGIGNGKIKHYSPDGTLLDTLDTAGGSVFTTGMGFDGARNLYVTVFNGQQVYKFDNNGTLLGTFGSGYNQDPESITFDKDGNAYVGQADGSKKILKFNSAGAFIDSYTPQTDDRGTDWIDLASDQCTIFYTSEGPHVKRFNVCTKTQLNDFATLPSEPAYALRLRPNGEVLVAATDKVYRLNASGVLQGSYAVPGAGNLFALNLDPDNKTFWTGDIGNGIVARVDIDTGRVITQFNAGALSILSGLSVFGEITAATSVPPSTDSYYVKLPTTTSVGKIHDVIHELGVKLAKTQLSNNTPQDSVVALLFGRPVYYADTHVYGASRWSYPTPTDDIAALVEDFVIGYYNALGTNRTAHVRLIVATSNQNVKVYNGTAPINIMFLHGWRWSQTVNSLADWTVSHGYSGQVDIAGGINIESGFNGSTPTQQWIAGYSTVAQRYLYNLGAAYNFTNEELWQLSWALPPSEPLPEIYSFGNAAQWASLSSYSSQRHNGAVIMGGTLTELGGCNQYPDDTCKPPFSPAQGWQALYDKLKAAGVGQTIPWSTDIRWCDSTYPDCYVKQ